MTWAILSEHDTIHPLLREVLERVGLDADDAVVLQVGDGTKTPTPKEIREAVPALAEEVAALDGLKGILSLGNPAFHALSGETGITKNRGVVKAMRPEWGVEFSSFATLHPAMVARNPNYYNEWLKDIASFQLMLNPPVEDDEIVVVENQDAFDRFIIEALTVGALDIETTTSPAPGNKDQWVNLYGGEEELVSVAVTYDGATAFVFRDDEWLEAAWPHLTKTKWIMHNGGFDALALRALKNIDLTLEHDTMAMAYLLHEEERKSLEVLSTVYLGLPPYKGVDYANILDEPWDGVALMNGKDANRTFKLFRPLADELNEEKDLLRVYTWILMPAVRTLMDLTHHGVPVNRDALTKLTGEVEDETEGLLESLVLAAPDPDPEVYEKGWPKPSWWKIKEHGPYNGELFNPGSPKQVGHILFDIWKLPILEETDTGAPSTGDDVLAQLEKFSGEKPLAFIEDLRQYRKARKLVDSYLKVWPQLMDPNDHMHPRYKPLFVKTGRLSSEMPNIQNVPRDKRFRSVFGREDMTWMKADYSQIELRLAAWQAGETRMLRAFQAGDDLHALTASLVLGTSDGDARQVGKTLNFGLLYGAGANTLRQVARQDYGVHLSEGEAREYRNTFFKAYPMLRDWQQRSERFIRSRGEAISPLGRRRHLPDAVGFDDGKAYKAVLEGTNHPIQSMASDMLLVALDRVNYHVRDGWLVAEVHDEMDLLVIPSAAEKVAIQVKGIMEDLEWLNRWGIRLPVPIVAEVETGPNWGEVA